MLSVRPLEPLSEVLLLRNEIHGDSRGFHLEAYNAKAFQAATGLKPNFVQDNHSRSAKGVLRGIHYQLAPHAQGKLVRVANGSVFDVAVDLRKSSPTFGKWAGITLNATDGKMVWIPPGFGHAFLTLEDGTDFLYKTTDVYTPSSEAAIAWNDPSIAIDWPKEAIKNVQLSEKDKSAQRLSDAKVFN